MNELLDTNEKMSSIELHTSVTCIDFRNSSLTLYIRAFQVLPLVTTVTTNP